jgi:hypothetical protein
MMKETPPRKPQGKDVLVARINQHHARRRGVIKSGCRWQRRAVPAQRKNVTERRLCQNRTSRPQAAALADFLTFTGATLRLS